MCVCVRVCVCVRARACACVRACVCVDSRLIDRQTDRQISRQRERTAAHYRYTYTHAHTHKHVDTQIHHHNMLSLCLRLSVSRTLYHRHPPAAPTLARTDKHITTRYDLPLFAEKRPPKMRSNSCATPRPFSWLAVFPLCMCVCARV